MATTILVAGATGDLGGRIVDALLKRGGSVRAVVRAGAASDKVEKLQQRGVALAKADTTSVAELAEACSGASCVVSALAGLREVIVDAQTVLLDAAIQAGVPRFIPSDFSSDFTKLPAGQNRNFDLRREFHERLDQASIAATSIFNGAFAELLFSQARLLDLAAKRVTYWENPDQRLDFTTINDTAAFTAEAALDRSTPKALHIAGDQKSARELATLAGKVKGGTFELVRAGSLQDLATMIERTRAADPDGEKTLYPRWQGMQYTLGMFSGRATPEHLDNDRYPNLKWTTIRDLLTN
jgi:nucleoside-diphosphate-sugar epimerase